MAEGAGIESFEAAGYVEFVPAGQQAAGEYQCAECGYGVVVQQRLPLCPLCGCVSWEPRRYERTGRLDR